MSDTKNSSILIDKELSLPFHDQTQKSTWKNSGVTDVQAFIDAGCGVCAYASFNNSSIKNMIDRGICALNDPYVSDPIGETNRTSSKILEIAAKQILSGNPAIIYFKGKDSSGTHFVTVCGLNGRLPTDSEGNPECKFTTASMIRILDPFGGRYSLLHNAEKTYGSSTNIRY